MKLFKKIKKYFDNLKIQKEISKAKFIHIMFNDKFNKPFVDFLNRNFNNNEHIILCKRFFAEHSFPVGKNVFEIKTLKNLDFAKNEKIICHSLFDQELVDYLYSNQSLLKAKAYWAIWGGDLYNAPRDEKNDFVRKNFKGYLTDFDVEVAQDKYGIIGKPFYCIHAIFPITKEMLIFCQKSDNKYTKIQINNSCDESTLEMLDVLSRFKNENIKIATILSYGETQFKDEIIQKGKENFGDKFEYIEDYMTPSEYAQHLAQNDILILNQNRQQGVGNTIASISLGKKVYIRSDISTFKILRNFNINIFDTKLISKMEFKDFIQNNDFENNKKYAMKFFDNNYKASLWKVVFDAK